LKMYQYIVTLNLPNDWQGPGTTSPPYSQMHEALAKELQTACARIVPTTDCHWDVKPIGPHLEPAGLETIPMRDPGPGELARIERRGELERPPYFDIDARHGSVEIHGGGKKQKYAKCGNCGVRIPIGDDPTENHHAAMRHKITCGSRPVDALSDDDYQKQVDDFNAQPHVVAMRERFAATGNVLPPAPNMPETMRPQLAAGIGQVAQLPSPEEIRRGEQLAATPMPWWKRLFSWLSW
jgi:hypothetical protein